MTVFFSIFNLITFRLPYILIQFCDSFFFFFKYSLQQIIFFFDILYAVHLSICGVICLFKWSLIITFVVISIYFFICHFIINIYDSLYYLFAFKWWWYQFFEFIYFYFVVYLIWMLKRKKKVSRIRKLKSSPFEGK